MLWFFSFRFISFSVRSRSECVQQRQRVKAREIPKILSRHDVIHVFRILFAINILFASQPGNFSPHTCPYVSLLKPICYSGDIHLLNFFFSLFPTYNAQRKKKTGYVICHAYILALSSIMWMKWFKLLVTNRLKIKRTIHPLNGPEHIRFLPCSTKRKEGEKIRFLKIMYFIWYVLMPLRFYRLHASQSQKQIVTSAKMYQAHQEGKGKREKAYTLGQWRII